MKVLAIGAHPDDIEILHSDTLALEKPQGHKVFMAIAPEGGTELIWIGFEDEWLQDDQPTSTRFPDAIRQADPDVIFVHSPNDNLSDHRISGQTAIDCRIPATIRLIETSLATSSRVPHIFCLDNISGLGFEPEHHVDVSPVVETRQAMLKAHEGQNG